MPQKLTVLDPNALAFPVLCFGQGLVLAQLDPKSLTTATSAALRRRYFNDLTIVDRGGAVHRVRRAEKRRGVGWFWGYNIFLNRRIEVALFQEPTLATWSLEDTRNRVLETLGKWSGWSASGDLNDLRRAIEAAPTIRDVTNAVWEHQTRKV